MEEEDHLSPFIIPNSSFIRASGESEVFFRLQHIC